MYNTTAAPLTRELAEAVLARGVPLSGVTIRAIMRDEPDAAFSNGCSPVHCAPSSDACLRERTKKENAAKLAVQGWDSLQQLNFDTDYDVRVWRNGTPELLEVPYPGAHIGANGAVFTIDADVTNFQHLNHFEQRFWFTSNLIVVATATEHHPVSIHTITPQRPRPVC